MKLLQEVPAAAQADWPLWAAEKLWAGCNENAATARLTGQDWED